MSSPNSSPITSRPPQINFTDRFVQPPSALYVFRDDLLFIRSLSSAGGRTLRLRGRLLTPTGEVLTLDFVHLTAVGTRAPLMETFDLAEGFLLGLAVVPETLATSRGETFVTVGITRGGTAEPAITQVLFSGYIEGVTMQSWPGGKVLSSVEGPGRLLKLVSINPGAGVEITVTTPANVRWRVMAMAFDLATSATVAARLVELEFVVASTTVALIPANLTHAANETRKYSAAPLSAGGINTAGPLLIPIPENVILQEDDTVGTSTANLQFDDDFTAPEVYVEEWLQEA